MYFTYDMESEDGILPLEGDTSPLYLSRSGEKVFVEALVPVTTAFVAVFVEKASCSKIYQPYYVGRVFPGEMVEPEDIDGETNLIGCASLSFQNTPLRYAKKRPYLYSDNWEDEGEIKIYVLFLAEESLTENVLVFNSLMSEDELENRISFYKESSGGGGFSVNVTAHP